MGTSNDFLKIAFVFAIFLFTIACNLSESTKQNEEVKLETHSSIDIKRESDTINLLDLTKIKLQTDSISYKTFTYLGQKYFVDVLNSSDSFFYSYDSLYSSFDPLVRFYSIDCLRETFDGMMLRDESLKRIVGLNTTQIHTLSTNQLRTEMMIFWQEELRKPDYIDLIYSLENCDNSYLSENYNPNVVLKKYILLGRIIIRTDGGSQNALLDSLGLP
jgi:hypothetical protein